MTPKQNINDCHYDPEPNSKECDRRDDERRKEKRKGFTLMSMVGWICRREKERRG